MSDNEAQVSELIERWIRAVDTGDLDGVLADRADDIVMFDVPAPNDGVRGIEAYREAWVPFLRWQSSGARFELVSLEVMAGEDVAFAYALLRCGTPDELAADPDNRLRLTFGLRREAGGWLVTHEHHSFPLGGAAQPATAATVAVATAEREVRELHRDWFARTTAKDLDGLMAYIGDDVDSYEHESPLRYLGVEAVREVCRRGLEASTETVRWDVPDLEVLARDDLAVAWGLNRVRVEQPGGGVDEYWSRGTRIFRKADGAWRMVHQHLSYPIDLETGQARTDLRP